jgi:peptidoglycan hydrolase-like protein with peptidoglycan-binding domain
MEIVIGLLIAAIPQLAPFAPLLRIAPGVISAIRVTAPLVGGWIQAIKQVAPDLLPAFEELAAQLGLSGQHATAAAAQMMFDRDGTLWIQAALNRLYPNDVPLDVDGVYGALTKAAIEKFQAEHPPLEVDGWCGPATLDVLKEELPGAI